MAKDREKGRGVTVEDEPPKTDKTAAPAASTAKVVSDQAERIREHGRCQRTGRAVWVAASRYTRRPFSPGTREALDDAIAAL